jgi:diguanylate cyclase (GGDEF)-like protein/PAS domain S-box-containing protein
MIAGVICLVTGILILQTRRTASGSIPLGIFMFALSWWDLTYSLFWANAAAPYPNFWLYITYLSAVVVPATIMMFALQLSGLGHLLKRPFILALCIEPLFVLISLFTDSQHGLFFGDTPIEKIGMIMGGGPIFWTNVIYSYLLILFGYIVLVRRSIQTSGIYRKQIVVILIAISLPWLSSLLFVIGFRPFPNADNTPLTFTIAGLALTYALLRYRLLNIIPIARHVLIENMSDGLLVLDSQNRLVDINPAAEQVLRLTKKSRIGQPVEDVFLDWSDVVKALSEVNNTRVEVSIDYPSSGYLDLKVSPLYDRNRSLIGRLVVWRDITPLKRAQAELQEQAIRDPLTGLYNRRYLQERLEHELARARRENQPISFVMIDIDHFKKVNDTFGHNAGDIVLQKLATELLSRTRIGDIVCRYGGEEFLAVLPNVTSETAYEIAERWRKLFPGSTMPLEYTEIKATVSCGISEFPLHGNTSEELVSTADKALYYAKQAGRNRVMIWKHELRDQFARE